MLKACPSVNTMSTSSLSRRKTAPLVPLDDEEQRTEYFILHAPHFSDECTPFKLGHTTPTPSSSPHLGTSYPGTVLFPNVHNTEAEEEKADKSEQEAAVSSLEHHHARAVDAFAAFKKSIVDMEWESQGFAAEIRFEQASAIASPICCLPTLENVHQRLSRVDAIYGMASPATSSEMTTSSPPTEIQIPSGEAKQDPQQTGSSSSVMTPDLWTSSASSTYLEKHFMGPLKEQQEYYTLRLKEAERSTSASKDQLAAAKERKLQRQTKLEKHIQLTLLADLHAEKEAEFMKYDEKKRSIATELARMVRNTICMEQDKNAGKEVKDDLDNTRHQGSTPLDYAAVSEWGDLSQLRDHLLPHAEQLWKDVIQVPRLVGSDRATDGRMEMLSELEMPVSYGWDERRRTTRGGISGALEEEGWDRVRSAMWKACWDAHPYFSLYGGATEDHLKSKPLHTFLKSLRQVKREAFIGEELYRARITAAVPVAAPSGMMGASVSRRLQQQNASKDSVTPFFRYFKNEEALRTKDLTRKLEQLEQRVWYENTLIPWKQEAECLLKSQFQLLEYYLMPPAGQHGSVSHREDDTGESRHLMRVQLEWYVPKEEGGDGKAVKEEISEKTQTSIPSNKSSSHHCTVNTVGEPECPSLATRFLLRCGFPSVASQGTANENKADEEENEEELVMETPPPRRRQEAAKPIISISSSTVSFQTEMVMNAQLAQSVSKMNRRIMQREKSRSYGVSEDVRDLTPSQCTTGTVGDINMMAREPVDVLFSTPHMTPKAPEKSTFLDPYSGSSPGPRFRDGDSSKAFTVENFIRHHIVQGALTFSPAGFDRREQHRAEVQAQYRQQRELEEQLAEVLEENFQLERQIRDLEEDGEMR